MVNVVNVARGGRDGSLPGEAMTLSQLSQAKSRRLFSGRGKVDTPKRLMSGRSAWGDLAQYNESRPHRGSRQGHAEEFANEVAPDMASYRLF
jgi:hypothetical protein